MLYLNEQDVRALVTLQDAVDVLERAFRTWGEADVANLPRRRLPLPGKRVLNHMVACVPAVDAFGFKSYFTLPAGGSQLVTLYSLSEGRLLAMISAGALGGMRTAAASAVATRALARPDAGTVGVIGSGRHARWQLRAIALVRQLTEARVYSPTAENRDRFAGEMGEALGIPVIAMGSGREAVAGADIVITATKPTMDPVLLGDWIAPGTHVNAMGANNARQRELDDAAVLKAARVVVDDREQQKIEGCELIGLVAAGRLAWGDLPELGQVVRGEAAGRTGADQITLFNSIGIAFEDVVFGRLIYDRAVAAGRGREMVID